MHCWTCTAKPMAWIGGVRIIGTPPNRYAPGTVSLVPTQPHHGGYCNSRCTTICWKVPYPPRWVRWTQWNILPCPPTNCTVQYRRLWVWHLPSANILICGTIFSMVRFRWVSARWQSLPILWCQTMSLRTRSIYQKSLKTWNNWRTWMWDRTNWKAPLQHRYAIWQIFLFVDWWIQNTTPTISTPP